VFPGGRQVRGKTRKVDRSGSQATPGRLAAPAYQTVDRCVQPPALTHIGAMPKLVQSAAIDSSLRMLSDRMCSGGPCSTNRSVGHCSTSSAIRAASSSRSGRRRCVTRGWPTTAQVRRSETSSRERTCATHARLREELSIFPEVLPSDPKLLSKPKLAETLTLNLDHHSGSRPVAYGW
jgi:hypothetical protein